MRSKLQLEYSRRVTGDEAALPLLRLEHGGSPVTRVEAALLLLQLEYSRPRSPLDSERQLAASAERLPAERQLAASAERLPAERQLAASAERLPAERQLAASGSRKLLDRLRTQAEPVEELHGRRHLLRLRPAYPL
jgi:hypothetical protein